MKRGISKKGLLIFTISVMVVVSFIPLYMSGERDTEVFFEHENIGRSISSDDLAERVGIDQLKGLGYYGEGVKIAILDTGIDDTHSGLSGKILGGEPLVTVESSFVPLESPDDLDGHGTFIAGIIGGNGESIVEGLAPRADLWNVKVLDQNGEAIEDWIEDGLDWLLSLEEKPDIASLSFGANSQVPDIEAKILELWEAGVIVVIASGNDGSDHFTVDFPANVLEAIAVGASSGDGYLMAFSSQGPSPMEYYYKPDVVAPGYDLISCMLGGGYGYGSGTSFSTPVVASGIALLIEATGHTVTPDEIKASIIDTCIPLGYGHFMEGAGIPDFPSALELLLDSTWDGFAVLPTMDLEFPIQAQSEIRPVDPFMLKFTVINSRLPSVSVEVTGELIDKIAIGDFDGSIGQHAVTVEVMKTTEIIPSTKTGQIIFKHGTDVLVVINVTLELSSSNLVLWIIIILVGVMVGVISLLAVAYRKGMKALPQYQKCELDGTCPIP